MLKYNEFGPEKVLCVYDPKTRMKGFLAIDNTALGVAKGGIRMTPHVTKEEVADLARVMTWKTALAELPFGGGKAGIVLDNNEKARKRELVIAFAKAVREYSPSLYVSAPDVNVGEQEMAEYAKINGLSSCTGKPSVIEVNGEKGYGLPHELGSTGYGVFEAIMATIEYLKLNPSELNVAVEGFGNVGSFAAKFLSKAGFNIVAVSDSRGCVTSNSGLEFEKLEKVKKETGSVVNYQNATVIPNTEIFSLDVDILVPAALSYCINEKTAENIKAEIIVEGSNIPIIQAAEAKLNDRGVLIIPDLIANAGGVISSYVEYIGKGNDTELMFSTIKERVRKNTRLILEECEKPGMTPREAGIEIAKRRIREKSR